MTHTTLTTNRLNDITARVAHAMATAESAVHGARNLLTPGSDSRAFLEACGLVDHNVLLTNGTVMRTLLNQDLFHAAKKLSQADYTRIAERAIV